MAYATIRYIIRSRDLRTYSPHIQEQQEEVSRSQTVRTHSPYIQAALTSPACMHVRKTCSTGDEYLYDSFVADLGDESTSTTKCKQTFASARHREYYSSAHSPNIKAASAPLTSMHASKTCTNPAEYNTVWLVTGGGGESTSATSRDQTVARRTAPGRL